MQMCAELACRGDSRLGGVETHAYVVMKCFIEALGEFIDNFWRQAERQFGPVGVDQLVAGDVLPSSRAVTAVANFRQLARSPTSLRWPFQ
jgi:hypothetical protein